MFSNGYCRIFKITCFDFEEHLWPSASIRCYLDTINLKQSGFCTTYSFKILVSELGDIIFPCSERKCINNLKNLEFLKQKIIIQILDVYMMFYYEIPWFYQDFKSENLCFLNPYWVDAARIPVNRDHVESNETPS